MLDKLRDLLPVVGGRDALRGRLHQPDAIRVGGGTSTTLEGSGGLTVRLSAGFAALFDQYTGMVLSVCRMLLRDVHEAEDAAQQTFLSAYRSLLGGTLPQKPAAWLATVARNECRMRMTRRTNTPATVSLPDQLHASPVAVCKRMPNGGPRFEALTGALGDLPERQREAVVLRDFCGLPYGEVAAAMSVSEPAVESLLVRGRRALERRVAPVRALPGVVSVSGSPRSL